ncbi:four helix bundle protein [Desertivirga arenae]|uniref:four helix bundle protein n=1 Tax=Desertivirga arenae TaxID=2810309 RepID=UPI001A97B5A5|nr:four helix bundle protein [Pedobacter sp. SYSU D00823]
MDKEILKKRTKAFSIEIAHLVQSLPFNIINKDYSNQIIRCSSSVGANYRAACRAKSKADFINKLKIVEEELDESMFFLELLVEFNQDQKTTIIKTWKEANELLSIIVSSITTLRKAMASQS